MDIMTLMEQAHAAGLSVKSKGEKLVVRGPRGAEPLALQLLADKAGVIAHLRRKRLEGIGYSREDFGWVLGLDISELPSPPFRLNSEMTVVDSERFLRSLRTGIGEGPNGPRARTGALQTQCQELREVIGRMRQGQSLKAAMG